MAKYQLTTICLANCQLTTNPIGILLQLIDTCTLLKGTVI